MRYVISFCALHLLLTLFTPLNSFAAERIATHFDFWSQVKDVAVFGDRALLAVPSHGLVLLDISDPANPTQLEVFEQYNQPQRIERFGDQMLILQINQWIRAQLTDEDQVIPVDTFDFDLPGSLEAMWRQESHIIIETVSYINWPPFVYFTFYFAVFEISEEGIIEIGRFEWGYGDVLIDIISAAYVSPCLFLSDPVGGTIRINLETGHQNYLPDPLRAFYAVAGEYLYASSDGILDVYNAVDPSDLQFVRSVEASLTGESRQNSSLLYGGWTTAEWGGVSSQLFMIDISDPEYPVMSGLRDYGHAVSLTFLTNTLACVVGSDLTLYDWSNPEEWQLLGQTSQTNHVRSVVAYEGYAYPRLDDNVFPILDLSDPANPATTGENLPEAIALQPNWGLTKDKIFVPVDDPQRLDIYGLDDPLEPQYLSSFALPNGLTSVDKPIWLYDNTFAIQGQATLVIFDLNDPTNPNERAVYSDLRMTTMSNLRGLRTTAEGLEAWNFHPDEPQLTSVWYDTTYGGVRSASLYGHHALVICGKWNRSPDGEWTWTDYRLLSLDYSDWNAPTVRWVRDLGRDPRLYLGPRYGRYQVLIDRSNPSQDRFRIFDAEGAGARGPWVDVQYSLNGASIMYPYLLIAEGRHLSIYDISSEMVVGVQQGDLPDISRPTTITLLPPYPNPFNAGTMVGFELPSPMRARISIFDLLGREVAVLADRQMTGGQQRLYWDGRSSTGSHVASGVYLVRLETTAQQAMQRVTLVK